MSLVKEYINKKVEVVTTLGKVYIGILTGYDNFMNIVLKNSIERTFSKEGVSNISCGLLILRGDEIMVIGGLNEEKDTQLDWQCVVSNPLSQALI
ncbi:LSM domain containing protein [Entamoeba histolytica HM-1:IMSS-B]|uniref:U6 snRNA-associated Sm-like protein LSm8 n=8 Tax=Entamoeba TaxID=5758 RepID=B1N3A8_ENTH1|nr:U6 snRNA-associated Sm-like protein LSm8, putative [Entamoeba histolytica HM-1:IMSS]XP_008860199.1 LSM domain containing protein [Entamoeba nuttalli P19]EMD48345.1 U6 snrnaassociated Sm family LSm8 protein [Entamoeba histolytica KU27]EMH73663.1 LSM domain containing protein [Entamoeba histolytica HM-1:IMSS-B]EMS11592.1 U6 snRNA-associated Sm family protein LSm8, putative [Entamoeba histolytica HM-3:IMSS]ENY63220.1 U6 snRNA-associated Sm family protein LSm8, putative [Entamoeba histolytica H|eukprot:XP_008860199.1 LSM domain containing protein [Entamoeba nuttalli P19]